MDQDNDSLYPGFQEEVYNEISKELNLNPNQPPTKEDLKSFESLKFWYRSKICKLNVFQQNRVSMLKFYYELSKPSSPKMPLDQARGSIKQACQTLRDEVHVQYEKALKTLEVKV